MKVFNYYNYKRYSYQTHAIVNTETMRIAQFDSEQAANNNVKILQRHEERNGRSGETYKVFPVDSLEIEQ